jgi:hypothetical protein
VPKKEDAEREQIGLRKISAELFRLTYDVSGLLLRWSIIAATR